MTNYLRPDEKARDVAIEKSRQSDERLKSTIKTGSKALIGAATGGAAIAGAKLGGKIMPFLNEHIPYDLALKGINKVSPELGGFLKKGLEKGLNLKDGFEFVKENLSNKQEEKTQTKPEEKNIIQKYSPSLYEEMKQLISKGMSPFDAAKKVKGRFGVDVNSIKQMEKDYKTDWFNIVESIFGKGDVAQSEQQQPQQGQGAQSISQAMQRITKLLG